jgi:hypothetical protein
MPAPDVYEAHRREARQAPAKTYARRPPRPMRGVRCRYDRGRHGWQGALIRGSSPAGAAVARCPRRLLVAERGIRGSGSQGAGTRLATDATGESPPRAADRPGPGHRIAARAARSASPEAAVPPGANAMSAVACRIALMQITQRPRRATPSGGITLSDGGGHGERAPTRRYARRSWFLDRRSAAVRTGKFCAAASRP